MTEPTLVPEEEISTGLYLSDKEILSRLGFGTRKGYRILRMLERGVPKMPPYPKRDPLFCDRRYWPAVRAWHDEYHRVRGGGQPPAPPSEEPRWQENFDAPSPAH